MRRAALILAALAALSCGGAPKPHGRAATPDPCAAAAGRRFAVVAVPHGGGRPAPLLIVFHGLGDSARNFSSSIDLAQLGPRRGVVVVFMDAHAGHRWELNAAAGHHDVDATRRLVDDLVRSGCADRRRVYLTGFSNGGGFAARAACDLADRVAAAAPVAGSYTTLDPCPRGPHVALLEIHGARDPWFRTVPRLLGWWRPHDGCRGRPDVTRLRRGVTRARWPGCDVERIALGGTGHAWFGEFVVSGRDPTRLRASPTVLDFVLRHRRAP
jgi:polyhydroxybutyrate depolymerase